VRSEPARPDPDELLRQLADDERRQQRGRLRVYIGAAPGVGKTYDMLQEGQRRKKRGTDVVVGYVETHGRPLTAEALEGLEVVPRLQVPYQGVTLEEMDTDAVIRRRPQVALVDELAHTNAPGSRHEKRWQDVEDILAAGITVITTVNIQHLESLNDVVQGITGIQVRETVPDAVVDAADEVELVDISPEALRARMRHGNIYPPEQASRALESFFRPGNLAALRELALKRVAQDVEQQLHEYMHGHGLSGWQAVETVLVLLDNTPQSEVALRRAWRLAHGFDCRLIAAYPAALLRRQGMTRILTVALDLNADVRELPGSDLEGELTEIITREAVTDIVMLTAPHRVLRTGRRTTPERLQRRHPTLTLHLVSR
jgi:two-component system sensor histidine kinase KdpD